MEEENNIDNRDRLEERTIKSLFSKYDADRQVVLIRDLMEIAKVDSIIRNRRPIFINRIEIGAPKNETERERSDRNYRNRFDEWIYQFLVNFAIVVEQSELDAFFNLFERIVSESRGTGEIAGEDCDRYGLYAYDRLGCGDLFDMEEQKRNRCIDAFDNYSPDEFVIFSTVIADNIIRKHYIWEISMSDLYVNLLGRGEDVHIILFFLGYYHGDPIMIERLLPRIRALFIKELPGDLSGEALKTRFFRLCCREEEDPLFFQRLQEVFPGLKVNR